MFYPRLHLGVVVCFDMRPVTAEGKPFVHVCVCLFAFVMTLLVTWGWGVAQGLTSTHSALLDAITLSQCVSHSLEGMCFRVFKGKPSPLRTDLPPHFAVGKRRTNNICVAVLYHLNN